MALGELVNQRKLLYTDPLITQPEENFFPFEGNYRKWLDEPDSMDGQLFCWNFPFLSFFLFFIFNSKYNPLSFSLLFVFLYFFSVGSWCVNLTYENLFQILKLRVSMLKEKEKEK